MCHTSESDIPMYYGKHAICHPCIDELIVKYIIMTTSI